MSIQSQTHPNPKHVVFGASVAAVLAIAGSGLATLALGPIPPPHWDSLQLGTPIQTEAQPGTPTQMGRAPLCTNIFDASGSLCSTQPPPESPVAELESCSHGPRLVGLVFDVDENRSLALFDGYGPRAEGEALGTSTVVAIHDDEAWLVTTTSRCRLGLFDRSQREPIVDEPPAPRSVLRPVPRDVVRQVMSDPGLLGRARLVPSRDGFRVYGMRSGELLYDAGLRNGDALQRIGNQDIHEPDDLLSAYSRYREASSLEVVVRREGEDRLLRVESL